MSSNGESPGEQARQSNAVSRALASLSDIAKKKVQVAKERFVASTLALNGLSDVEQVIGEKLVSDAELLREIPKYLFKLGGKRVRPILTLLSASALGMPKPSRQVIDVAAGIELIHMATLLHDDIIDGSSIRRHHSSPFARYGLSPTLLAGDFLLVRAFALCAKLDQYVISATEQACVELTEGEILEVPLSAKKHTIESSLTIAKKKTAALFRLSTESGAHFTVKDQKIVDHMASFGEDLGIAFQVVDDILDVTSTEEVLGKTPGTDIRERKPSAVNVLWLESGSELAKRLLTQGEVAPSSADVEAALAELNGSTGEGTVVDAAHKLAHRYVESARRHLTLATQDMPSNIALEGLHALIDYCVERIA